MGSHAAGPRRMLLAWVAAAAVLFGSAAPLVAGHLAVDTDCAPAIAQPHDHDAHRLSRASDEPADHCGACHLARSARTTTPRQTLIALAPLQREALQPAGSGTARPTFRAPVTRGPPHSS